MRCFAFLDAGGADLSGQTICGIDLRFANLSEAHFYNVTVLHCDLRNASLERATFLRTNLSGSVQQQARPKQTSLSGIALTGPEFEEVVVLEGDVMGHDSMDNGVTFERHRSFGRKRGISAGGNGYTG